MKNWSSKWIANGADNWARCAWMLLHVWNLLYSRQKSPVSAIKQAWSGGQSINEKFQLFIIIIIIYQIQLEIQMFLHVFMSLSARFECDRYYNRLFSPISADLLSRSIETRMHSLERGSNGMTHTHNEFNLPFMPKISPFLHFDKMMIWQNYAQRCLCTPHLCHVHFTDSLVQSLYVRVCARGHCLSFILLFQHAQQIR